MTAADRELLRQRRDEHVRTQQRLWFKRRHDAWRFYWSWTRLFYPRRYHAEHQYRQFLGEIVP